MQKCTTYGPDKLGLRPFYHLTFKSEPDLQPTRTNVSNGTSTQGQQLCQTVLKSMNECTSYGTDKSRWMHNGDGHTTHTHTTHAQCTHIHRIEVVTTMSHSSHAGRIKT